MLLTDQNPFNKHIMVSLLGKPNAGKSSLINHILGFDLSIVSSKPQTTRNHFHCAFTIENTEVVLVDTPGVHESSQELNIRMNGQAQFGAEGVDLNLILIDATTSDLVSEFKSFLKTFDQDLNRSWVVFTKYDLVKEKNLDYESAFKNMQELLPSLERFFVISTKEKTNIEALELAIEKEAKEGPHFYPNGEVSNKNERFFATEYIREQAFKILKEELPYELAVVIEDYEDVKNHPELHRRISAAILVNRPSQRAIVVGRAGSVIKAIGSEARKKIEAMVGGQIALNLHVKVSPKWFKNNWVLDELGLPRTQKSNRVWRQK